MGKLLSISFISDHKMNRIKKSVLPCPGVTTRFDSAFGKVRPIDINFLSNHSFLKRMTIFHVLCTSCLLRFCFRIKVIVHVAIFLQIYYSFFLIFQLFFCSAFSFLIDKTVFCNFSTILSSFCRQLSAQTTICIRKKNNRQQICPLIFSFLLNLNNTAAKCQNLSKTKVYFLQNGSRILSRAMHLLLYIYRLHY